MAGRVVLAVGAVVALMAIGAPSASAGLTGISVKVAKQKDGDYKTYLGNVGVPANGERNLWFRIKAAASNEEQRELRFTDDGSSSELENFKVKWFKHGENVSAAVRTEGQPFKVDPGEKKYFNASITRTDPGGGFCLEGVAVEGFIDSESASAGIETDCAF